MKVRLFAQVPPEGRCLILAQKLIETSRLAPGECLALAERLFAFEYERENPALVELRAPEVATDLAVACAQFGIMVDAMATDARLE
jgi:hypothetical protein